MEKELTITLDQLAKLCAEYDGHGTYRYAESEYEGYTVFNEIYQKLTNKSLYNEADTFGEEEQKIKDTYFKYTE